jgi:hypothetical protein
MYLLFGKKWKVMENPKSRVDQFDLAEIAATCWGNIHAATRIIG